MNARSITPDPEARPRCFLRSQFWLRLNSGTLTRRSETRVKRSPWNAPTLIPLTRLLAAHSHHHLVILFLFRTLFLQLLSASLFSHSFVSTFALNTRETNWVTFQPLILPTLTSQTGWQSKSLRSLSAINTTTPPPDLRLSSEPVAMSQLFCSHPACFPSHLSFSMNRALQFFFR